MERYTWRIRHTHARKKNVAAKFSRIVWAVWKGGAGIFDAYVPGAKMQSMCPIAMLSVKILESTYKGSDRFIELVKVRIHRMVRIVGIDAATHINAFALDIKRQSTARQDSMTGDSTIYSPIGNNYRRPNLESSNGFAIAVFIVVLLT